jgi:opacity protein-like surface antigen
MRRIVFVFAAALTVMSPAADAADLKALKAPSASAYSWAGAYIGVHAGAGASNLTYYDPAFPAWSLSHRPQGAIGGLQVGYNQQYGAWVVGAEADVSAGDIKGGITDTQPGFAGDRFDAKVRWLGTFTGRAGYAVDRTLIYAKAGFGWANTHVDYLFGGGGFGPAAVDVVRWGWTAGAGIEQALWNGWSAKAEYNYVDFGNSGLVIFAPLPDGFVGSFAQDLHLVKLGLNYRFGR